MTDIDPTTHIELHRIAVGEPDERRRLVPVLGTMFMLDAGMNTVVSLPNGVEFTVEESLDEIKGMLKEAASK